MMTVNKEITKKEKLKTLTLLGFHETAAIKMKLTPLPIEAVVRDLYINWGIYFSDEEVNELIFVPAAMFILSWKKQ